MNAYNICKMETTNNTEKPDSIEINKNSKGYTWKIKRYYNKETDSIDEVMLDIEKIDIKLKSKYGVKNE